MSSEQPTLDLRWLDGPETAWWVGLIAFELALLIGYFGITGATLTDPRYVLYPFVWFNAGIWAIRRVEPPTAPTRQRWGAATIATVYGLVLAYVTGMLGTIGHHTNVVGGFSVRMASPGWGPIVTYAGFGLHITILPYRLFGYAVLAFLVYVTVLKATRAAAAGVLGLGACVGCAFPIVSAFLIQTVGTTALAGAIYAHSVDLSTVVFLVTVGLLTHSAD